MNQDARKLLERTGHRISFTVDHPWPASMLAELLPALFEETDIGVDIDIKTGQVTLYRKERGPSYDG